MGFVFLDHVNKTIEQWGDIVRTGTGLGMVLNREHGFILHTDPHYGIVVKVKVGYLDPFSFLGLFPVYGKTVVLRGDLALPGPQVDHRVVDPAMAMMHFKGRYPVGQGYDLVPQAYPEKW